MPTWDEKFEEAKQAAASEISALQQQLDDNALVEENNRLKVRVAELEQGIQNVISALGALLESGGEPPNEEPPSDIEARRQETLEYIANIPSPKFMAGQFGMYGEGWDPATADATLNEIWDRFSVHVAMTGADYGAHDASKQEVTDWLIKQANNEYVIMASWHAPSPFTGKFSGDPDDHRPYWGRFNELISPINWDGTGDQPPNVTWKSMLDEIAGHLKQLQDAGHVVLWRPFHEMNGGWFWWADQDHPADFVKLWQHMCKYFTETKGLKNLIWVYSPNDGYDEWTLGAIEPMYPGDAYVDIVSLDKYGAAKETNLKLNGYTFLTGTGKPFILGEFGPRPASAAEAPDYDTRRLITDIANIYPKVKGVMFWEAWVHGLTNASQTHVQEFLNDPNVITRMEVEL